MKREPVTVFAAMAAVFALIIAASAAAILGGP
jgi:hypothetical protein